MNTPQIVLDDWQKEALAHEGNLLLCTGRQVGKTYILSRKAAERMVKKKTNILVGSLTEDQAKLIIVMTLRYLEDHYPTWLKVKKSDKPTQSKITLTNGSTIIARPVGNTGDALRGFTGDVFIPDEMSRWPPLAWIAGLPTLLTTGGEIWGASTPFGKEGFFYEAYQNKDNFWKVIHVSSEEVIKNRKICDAWTEKQREGALRFLDQQKEQMSELQYAQEYLGQFIDDLRRYFSDELIEKCCVLEKAERIPREKTTALGVDIARMGDDETSYQIVQRNNKKELIHLDSQVRRKQLTTQTEKQIISLQARHNFDRIFIDAGAGSLGVGILDHLLNDPKTKKKVVAINNRTRPIDRDGKKTRLLKEDLYDNLRSLMEKGHIKLLNDEAVITSLRGMQYEFISKAGQQTQLRIFGKKGRDGDHIAEALVRAAWINKEKVINMRITWV